ncbi:MAG: RNA 2',3'-cyclic phosphodiesterase [Candidatus Omnitrophica bacterium]|nr:RNA 2',3'-cyclic phosphodiesterase [Candidatus Omnitrophota bacterium]
MSDKIRTFIAIELDKQTQESLAKIQNELKASGSDVKWVEPKNIHLTLKFLGDIETDLIPKIKNMLEDLSKNHNKFSAAIKELGAFPNARSPRVIWVGIEAGKENSVSIANDLDNNLSKLGIPKEERDFVPHLTLGRVKRPINRFKLSELINKNKDISDLNFVADRITLFKSTLTPKGPIYEAMVEVNLKES